MNIWIVCSAKIPPTEGIGYYVWNLSRQLVQRGHEVYIVTRRLKGENSQEVIDGITIHRPFYLPFFPFHVHIHSFFVSRLLTRHINTIDVIHYHEPLVKYINLQKPTVATVHTSVFQLSKIHEINNFADLLFYFMIPVRRKIASDLLRSVDEVTTVSEFVADSVKENLKDIGQVEVMWNALDHTVFYPIDDSEIEACKLLYVGRISRYKGLDDLLDAISTLIVDFPQIQLNIVGQGDYQYELERKVQKLDLYEHVEFFGQVKDRARLAGIYRSSTVFVLPSFNEGMPTVVLEAMACGLPVVATNVAGIPDLIANGAKCSVVPMKNPSKLAAAIKELLLSSSLRKEYRQKSYKVVADKYNWNDITENFIRIFQQALDNK